MIKEWNPNYTRCFNSTVCKQTPNKKQTKGLTGHSLYTEPDSSPSSPNDHNRLWKEFSISPHQGNVNLNKNEILPNTY